jgi:hypothetical protein
MLNAKNRKILIITLGIVSIVLIVAAAATGNMDAFFNFLLEVIK